MILAIGPFIGSFEQEVITFRPYVRWLYDVVPHNKIYINTHFNRKFLYDFIPEENIIPVYDYLTMNEDAQRGYVHKTVTLKDFNILTKEFKHSIIEKENCSYSDIKMYNISYAKTTPHYPIYNKVFTPIQCFKQEYPEDVVYIPYGTSKKNMDKVYNFLYGKSIVIGDLKCKIKRDNKIIKRKDYPLYGPELIMSYITNAKLVVCPISFWTTICNLQGVRVFSWGEGIGPYIKDGMYNFDNDKTHIYAVTKPDEVISLLENVLKNIT